MSTTAILNEKDFDQPPIDTKTLSEKDKQELILAETLSITSDTTLGLSELSFQPSNLLQINTRGVPVLRLPIPPSELQITIHNIDGSLAYTSTRERRSSGNCILANAEGHHLIGTSYFFGPNKDPVLTRLDVGSSGTENEIKTLSKWTSRDHKFLLPDGRNFEWAYKKQKGFGTDGKKGTALVLTLGGKRIAALIRNDHTRTPGSKSCNAGNGGELVLGEEVGGKEGISEELVLATCLLMLKKEIDRRRAIQFTMLMAAVSGGT